MKVSGQKSEAAWSPGAPVVRDQRLLGVPARRWTEGAPELRSTRHSLCSDRRGVALLAAMLTLVILSSLLAAIGWQIMANRRVLAHRENEIQAAWLARSGIEHAAARLLADPAGYVRETIEVIPRATVEIKVSHEAGSDIFRVTSEASYPASSREPVVRSETRRFRRIVDGEMVRLEFPGSGEQ